MMSGSAVMSTTGSACRVAAKLLAEDIRKLVPMLEKLATDAEAHYGKDNDAEPPDMRGENVYLVSYALQGVTSNVAGFCQACKTHAEVLRAVDFYVEFAQKSAARQEEVREEIERAAAVLDMVSPPPPTY